MKGMLVKVLVVVLISSCGVVAQNLPPVFDSTYTIEYASRLSLWYPATRDFNGGGARAKGMGNAFLGVSDDASAVSWNPAGLYRQDNPYEQPVIALSYQSFSANSEARSNPWSVRDTTVAKWSQYDYDEVFGGVDFMSIVAPIRFKGHMFVGSLAYTRLGDEVQTAGMSVDVLMPMTFEDSLEAILNPYHYSYVEQFNSAVNALNVGFGTRLYDKLSGGIAVNVYGGNAAKATAETVIWEGMIHPTLPGKQRITGRFENRIYDSTSFSGVYFNIGLKYTTDFISVGLVMKTPHRIKQERDIRVESVWYSNDFEQAGSGAVIHIDNLVVELDQPLVLGLGLGVNVTDNLLMAADVEYRNFGSSMINVRDSLRLVPGAADIEFFSEVDPHWNTSWVLRFGTEYVWNTGNSLFPEVPLRVGFGYIEVPEPDVTGVDKITGELVYAKTAQTRFSFGAGVRWDQVKLDMAYAVTSIDQENKFYVRKQSSDNGTFNFTFTGFF